MNCILVKSCVRWIMSQKFCSKRKNQVLKKVRIIKKGEGEGATINVLF